MQEKQTRIPYRLTPQKIALFTRYARVDNPYLYYLLGEWYKAGKYVKKNYKRAIGFFRKAAYGEIEEAMHALAVSYQKGTGVAKNPRQVYLHFLAAAIRDYKPAMEAIKAFHLQGIGIDKKKPDIVAIWQAYTQGEL